MLLPFFFWKKKEKKVNVTFFIHTHTILFSYLFTSLLFKLFLASERVSTNKTFFKKNFIFGGNIFWILTTFCDTFLYISYSSCFVYILFCETSNIFLRPIFSQWVLLGGFLPHFFLPVMGSARRTSWRRWLRIRATLLYRGRWKFRWTWWTEPITHPSGTTWSTGQSTLKKTCLLGQKLCLLKPGRLIHIRLKQYHIFIFFIKFLLKKKKYQFSNHNNKSSKKYTN